MATSFQEKLAESRQWQFYHCGELKMLLRQTQSKIEDVINRTPSGVGRNLVCDINIKLGELQKEFDVALKRMIAEAQDD